MFEKEKKYFPKITDPQCQLKWNWSTLMLTEGTTSTCHRCENIPLNLENFNNFHNLPFKIKEREIMLSGKWPTVDNGGSGHCTYCKKVEDVGGVSDRMNMLTIPNQVPPELFQNPRATTITPKILEIFMNDTCNLKCTYCNIRDSSQWKNEIKRFGPLYQPNGKIFSDFTPDANAMQKHKNHKLFFQKTLEWIEKNGHHLSRLHLLGGETFYQSELKQVLDVLGKIKNPHLELNILSNLMVKEDTFKTAIEQIKKLCKDRNIGRFDLTASIDGWGPEAEYARSGLKLDYFEKLFAYAVNEKWIILHTNQTITSMSVRSIPALNEKIKQYRKINKKITLRFMMVHGMPQLHPEAFGYNFWQDDVKKILQTMPTDDNTDNKAILYMKGLFDSIQNKEPNFKTVQFFKYYLDQLDKRRNTNWRKVFPYLDI
jgi:organic radical activating enzyme